MGQVAHSPMQLSVSVDQEEIRSWKVIKWMDKVECEIELNARNYDGNKVMGIEFYSAVKLVESNLIVFGFRH